MAEIVFYKHKHGKFLDHLVAWLSRGPYSHVEFKLADGPYIIGPCISASFRDGGFRCKHIDLDSGKWKRYRINDAAIKQDSLAQARAKGSQSWWELAIAEWALTQAGLKYDTLGVLLVPFTWWKNKRFRLTCWFCSEVASYICRKWKIFPVPTTQISPNGLERICRAHPEVFEPLN